MVRSMDGHGLRTTRKPSVSLGRELPASSTTSTAIPGSGTCAEPGLAWVTPGSGEIMIAPVSVCHHVSTMGQRSPPITRWNQVQASGLMASPTVPSKRSELRSHSPGISSPHFIMVRMAVGEV